MKNGIERFLLRRSFPTIQKHRSNIVSCQELAMAFPFAHPVPVKILSTLINEAILRSRFIWIMTHYKALNNYPLMRPNKDIIILRNC